MTRHEKPVVEQVGSEHWLVTYTVTEQRTRSFWNEDAAKKFGEQLSQNAACICSKHRSHEACGSDDYPCPCLQQNAAPQSLDCSHYFHDTTGSGFCPRCGKSWKRRHLPRNAATEDT